MTIEKNTTNWDLSWWEKKAQSLGSWTSHLTAEISTYQNYLAVYPNMPRALPWESQQMWLNSDVLGGDGSNPAPHLTVGGSLPSYQSQIKNRIPASIRSLFNLHYLGLLLVWLYWADLNRAHLENQFGDYIGPRTSDVTFIPSYQAHISWSTVLRQWVFP